MPCSTVSVAITGASGVRYGLRLVQVLPGLGARLAGVVVTREALEIARYEEGLEPERLRSLLQAYGPVYDELDFSSPLSSSSNQPDCMAIVPASMNVVGMIANGIEANLVARAALSVLRLGRRLVVAFREAPLAVPHLRNLLSLAEMGAIVMPLAPAFYSGARTVDELVDFMVGKVLDALGISHSLYRRWSGPPRAPPGPYLP